MTSAIYQRQNSNVGKRVNADALDVSVVNNDNTRQNLCAF